MVSIRLQLQLNIWWWKGGICEERFRFQKTFCYFSSEKKRIWDQSSLSLPLFLQCLQPRWLRLFISTLWRGTDAVRNTFINTRTNRNWAQYHSAQLPFFFLLFFLQWRRQFSVRRLWHMWRGPTALLYTAARHTRIQKLLWSGLIDNISIIIKSKSHRNEPGSFTLNYMLNISGFDGWFVGLLPSAGIISYTDEEDFMKTE